MNTLVFDVYHVKRVSESDPILDAGERPYDLLFLHSVIIE